MAYLMLGDLLILGQNADTVQDINVDARQVYNTSETLFPETRRI